MKLTIKDRLVIGNLYPKEGDILTQLLVKSIKEKVRITEEEIKEIQLRKFPNGNISYQTDRAKELLVDFTEDELTVLKQQVEKLDKQKKVTQSLVDLCIKIKEAK